mgnify:CR=1 FL=1
MAQRRPAAGVAHEVNTPLTGISSYTQMLLEGADPDDPRTALLEKIEQVVRLIRSKGVGVYFITQNPLDIPETDRKSTRLNSSHRT